MITKLINIEDVDKDFLRRNYNIDNVSFLAMEDCSFVYNSCNGDMDAIRGWFDKIGIKYDSLSFVGELLVYSINGKQLLLSDLSSGERYLLFLLACKNVNRKVVALSLFERLGGRLEDLVYNEFKDYDNLTVIIFNFIIKPEFRYLYKAR